VVSCGWGHVRDEGPGSPSGRSSTDLSPLSREERSAGIVVQMSDLTELRDRMRAFTADRDWVQFHDPKSLLLALMGEVGELSELFQWLPAEKAALLAVEEPLKTRVSEEMADVLIYLVRLTDVLDIDLAASAHSKLDAAERRFPVHNVRGAAPRKS